MTGRIAKQEGAFWSADVDAIGLFTQGTSPTDAAAMIKDAIEGLVNRPGFEVTVTEIGIEANALVVEITANLPQLLEDLAA